MSKSSLLITLPEQTQQQHSLFEVNAKAAREWKSHLPKANLGESSRQLYKALEELTQVKAKGRDRLEVLDILSPMVHQVTKTLSQFYTNQPIVLPAKAAQIFQLSSTLNRLLATGYCQAFADLEQSSRLLKPKELMARTLYQAINEFCCILLRGYKLYRPAPEHFWKNLHSLYHTAASLKLEKIKVPEQGYPDGSIQLLYVRALILSISRTHQIPQRYIDQVYFGLRYWCGSAELLNKGLERCTLLIDPSQDRPPVYRELYQRAPAPGWLGLDTRKMDLSPTSLNNMVNLSGKQYHMPETILMQLCTAWHSATERAADRIACNETIRLSIGINASHYFVANHTSFKNFQFEDKEQEKGWLNIDTQPLHDKDVWSQNKSYDTREAEDDNPSHFINVRHQEQQVEEIDYSLPITDTEAEARESNYSYQQVQALDYSANGYRIEWPATATQTIRTGEVIAVKAGEYESWRLGTVRWLRSNDSNQMGLEIFSNTAVPCSACLVQSGLSNRDYQRAFLLPSTSDGTPQRILLTSLAGFTEGRTLQIQENGFILRIRLTDLVESSSAFKLFGYQDLQGTSKSSEASDTANQADNDDDQFHKLWDVL